MFFFEIMGICFFMKISYIVVLNFKRIIKEYLIVFKDIYRVRILLKQYYLVYLLFQIMMFGFFIRIWCMRFEVKYVYFKDVVQRFKNFKNFLFFLIKWYQYLKYVDMLKVDEDDKCFLFKDDL